MSTLFMMFWYFLYQIVKSSLFTWNILAYISFDYYTIILAILLYNSLFITLYIFPLFVFLFEFDTYFFTGLISNLKNKRCL